MSITNTVVSNELNYSTERRRLKEKIDDQEKALETKDNELSQLRSPKARRVDVTLLENIDFRAITPAEVIPSESPGKIINYTQTNSS